MSPTTAGEPADPATQAQQAQQALDEVRPYLEVHGGGVELVAVEPPIVRVRVWGACAGESRSAVTLREVVQTALVTRVAGVERVHVVPEEPAVTIPLGSVGVRRRSTEGGRDRGGPG